MSPIPILGASGLVLATDSLWYECRSFNKLRQDVNMKKIAISFLTILTGVQFAVATGISMRSTCTPVLAEENSVQLITHTQFPCRLQAALSRVPRHCLSMGKFIIDFLVENMNNGLRWNQFRSNIQVELSVVLWFLLRLTRANHQWIPWTKCSITAFLKQASNIFL